MKDHQNLPTIKTQWFPVSLHMEASFLCLGLPSPFPYFLPILHLFPQGLPRTLPRVQNTTVTAGSVHPQLMFAFLATVVFLPVCLIPFICGGQLSRILFLNCLRFVQPWPPHYGSVSLSQIHGVGLTEGVQHQVGRWDFFSFLGIQKWNWKPVWAEYIT